ncbi:hypothetical protein [Sphingomonas endolithica]|uniref:hypothetical protein n=1 Tax=Sphingomonas endolithica TaxID=2972485 RepID=UPI0021AFD34C|nr:hypothetical protein [Sphingomonas sp. ZFBP2030]
MTDDATRPTPTETQPAPNLSTEQEKTAGANTPTETQPAPNISTEHQEAGGARFPGSSLDRGQEDEGDVARKSSLTRNE